ncbi:MULTISPECIES: type IV pilin N-terminal domain-containing protein [unclassified Methanoculleus]|jgi:FlaG/FlaF family flagellin (archaellin)|nr:type IV pilin N-terminal domain-containing protein [Methanoculleus sp. UBA377]
MTLTHKTASGAGKGHTLPRRDDAVSPVVGVMLMLVVTIIIAAVVSSFASGIGGTNEKAPVASLGFDVRAGEKGTVVHMENLGGEALYTGDLQIVTTYTLPEAYGTAKLGNASKTIKHTTDGSLPSDGTAAWDKNADPFTPQVSNENQNVVLGPGDTQARKFGKVILRPGERLKLSRNPFLGFDATERNKFGFQEGSVVHITVIHKPSGKFIYDKDVMVRW